MSRSLFLSFCRRQMRSIPSIPIPWTDSLLHFLLCPSTLLDRSTGPLDLCPSANDISSRPPSGRTDLTPPGPFDIPSGSVFLPPEMRHKSPMGHRDSPGTKTSYTQGSEKRFGTVLWSSFWSVDSPRRVNTSHRTSGRNPDP